jgi:2-dehydro-3-deoxyphosphogluconate aldolase/(4S)-4-hydroxy-2-oxoglutarate aldolase
METSSWIKLLQKNRAIAVIRSDDLELAISMAQAVAAGGIKLIEITWNSYQPTHLISQLRTLLPHCTIGTGTVLSLEQLEAAIACGVEFCFTPHVNLKLIEAAIAAKIPIIPGALSPTEIVTAWLGGASCVKVFPVQAVGGVNYLKSLQGPLGQIPLIPTGGVTLDNASQFIAAGAIAVGLSGELFPKHLVKERDWFGITERAKKLVNMCQCNDNDITVSLARFVSPEFSNGL